MTHTSHQSTVFTVTLLRALALAGAMAPVAAAAQGGTYAAGLANSAEALDTAVTSGSSLGGSSLNRGSAGYSSPGYSSARAPAGAPASSTAQPSGSANLADFADDGVTYGTRAGTTDANGPTTAGEDATPGEAGVTGAAAAPSAPLPAASSGADGADLGGPSGAETGPPVTSGPSQTHRNALGDNRGDGPALSIKPYIEVGQEFDAYFSPNHDVLTYSEVAVGADARINGNYTDGTVSLRYEREFGWGRQSSGNTVAGLARMATAIVPGTLRIDYGGYADRAYVTASGAAVPDANTSIDALSQVWSVFAGPSLTTHAGVASLEAHYHAGYTSMGSPSGFNPATQSTPEAFEHSTVQDAGASVGVQPGEVLPVGLGVDGGYHQEDVSLLGQRIEDEHIRGTVTVPVTPTLHVVAGVGYEHVKVSSHNVELDANGNPVVGANGEYVSDTSTPRLIAFDTTGLIWDVGVDWRPSPRTALDAHYGRRYGANGAWGTFSWRPDRRQSINIAVYDNLSGFGGGLTDALVGTPTQFQALSDPVTGNFATCVATLQSGGCLASVLGSVTAEVYRDRGVAATYGVDLGHLQTGVGLGYDRHEYLAAPTSVLADINGKTDQYWWVAGYLTDELDRQSTLQGTIDAYRFQSGLSSTGDMTSIRAVGTYQRNFSRHLAASASLALDGINVQALDDIWAASGALSVRYTF